jgi:hypothetical protein
MHGELAFELPGSGQTLTIRSLTVEHVDLLASGRSRKTVDIISEKIIPECLGVPYHEYEKFLEGDEMATLIALRRATWGDEYDYPIRCPRCNSEGMDSVNLKEDLEIKILQPGQPTDGLEYEMYDDDDTLLYKIVWKIPRVADRILSTKELQLHLRETKGKQNYQVTFSVASRIEDILKPDPGNPERFLSVLGSKQGLKRRQAIRTFVAKQGAMFAQEFLMDLEEFSCGVETARDHECQDPDCGHSWREELPIQEGFFFLTKDSLHKRKRRRKRGKVKTPWKSSPESSSEDTTPGPSSSSSSTPSSKSPSSPPSP